MRTSPPGPRTSTFHTPAQASSIFFEDQVLHEADFTFRGTRAFSSSPQYQTWVTSRVSAAPSILV